VKRKTKTTLTALCFLLPNLLGFFVFMCGPVIFSLVVAFTNWNLTKTIPLRWIGFDNFAKLLELKSEFWPYLVNTVYLMMGMPIAIAGSLFLAVLLSQRLKGVVVYRTLFYLPMFTAGVAMLILWKKLYNPDFGPINLAIEGIWGYLRLGDACEVIGTGVLYNRPDSEVLRSLIHDVGWWFKGVLPEWLNSFEAPDWLSSTHNLLAVGAEQLGFDRKQFGLGAKDAIIIMGIWTVVGGSNMLLYLAGISNIPQDLYEAADIDGAGAWARFRHVTWPQLAPTTFFIVIMSFIGGLQGGFEQARVMTNGGPAGATTTLTFYLYTKAFQEFQIGYASAIAWILFAVIFSITLMNWRFGSRYVNY